MKLLAERTAHGMCLLLSGISPIALDRLPSGGERIRQRQHFRREIPGVANAPQRLDDRRNVRVAEADRLAVAVGEMDVPDQRAGFSQCSSDIDFFNVHVKQIAEQFDVLGFQAADEFHAVRGGLDQVCFVAVQSSMSNVVP